MWAGTASLVICNGILGCRTELDRHSDDIDSTSHSTRLTYAPLLGTEYSQDETVMLVILGDHQRSHARTAG